MVPASGAGFGDGFYQQNYDADLVCITKNEAPDWGLLTWFGTTPGNSEILFEVWTALERDGLDDDQPTEITVTDATSGEGIDIGQLLLSDGKPNGYLHLRVRARLNATSDGGQTPTLDGWSFRYDCVPSL